MTAREEEVDVDWEKVKTLPRVCLVPPEGTSRLRQLNQMTVLIRQRIMDKQSLSIHSSPHLPELSISEPANPTIPVPYVPTQQGQGMVIHQYGQVWHLDSYSPHPSFHAVDNL